MGGFSTEDEMCLAYLYYYPRVNSFGTCLSSGGQSGNADFDLVKQFHRDMTHG